LTLTIVLLILVVAATVVCAASSYWLVERPILRFKDGFGPLRPGWRSHSVGPPSPRVATANGRGGAHQDHSAVEEGVA
jgi:peptidoglycan/LPS O-acetylase OafA/YrhL